MFIHDFEVDENLDFVLLFVEVLKYRQYFDILQIKINIL